MTRRLGSSPQVTTRLPLAAVLVVSHGNDAGQIIPYTYLVWKYFTPRKPWRQWRDKRTQDGWDLDVFVGLLGLKRRGLLVLYGCDAASPGSSSTRHLSADSAGIAIAGWSGLVEWELPGVEETKDKRSKEDWNKLSFKDEEALRTDLKKKKEKLVGTGKARPQGGGTLSALGDLTPSTITMPRDYDGLGSGNVLALVRRTATAVVQELARQARPPGPQRSPR